MRDQILIVDDDMEFSGALKRALKNEFEVTHALSSALARKMARHADLILLDIRLDRNSPENQDGMTLLTEFHEDRPNVPIIMMTAYGDTDLAVESIKRGATDFLSKPLDIVKLKATIRNSLRQLQLVRNNQALQNELRRIEPVEFVGKGGNLRQIQKVIESIARDGYINVLITGETGTGKELIAKLIQASGKRANGPFVALSLAALAPSIIERELFGHEKGAFTDAKTRTPGYVEKADSGVLFLDDIDASPLEIQPKLLRFLEDRSFSRLGSTVRLEVDVQIVSATNKNLAELVEEGKFREDLLYRINAVEIHIPPLRERLEDIPILCHHFLKLFKRQGRTRVASVSREAIDIMCRYNWPGNIRELKNTLEASLLSIQGTRDVIEIDDLPERVRLPDGKNKVLACTETLSPGGIDLNREKARFELSCIELALKHFGEKKSEVWKYLGLNDRFALRRRVKRLNADYEDLLDSFPATKNAFLS